MAPGLCRFATGSGSTPQVLRLTAPPARTTGQSRSRPSPGWRAAADPLSEPALSPRCAGPRAGRRPRARRSRPEGPRRRAKPCARRGRARAATSRPPARRARRGWRARPARRPAPRGRSPSSRRRSRDRLEALGGADHRQVDPAGLHRRLPDDPVQPRLAGVRPGTIGSNDRPVGHERCDPVDAELGELGDGPLGPFRLHPGKADLERRGGALRELDRPGHLEAEAVPACGSASRPPRRRARRRTSSNRRRRRSPRRLRRASAEGPRRGDGRRGRRAPGRRGRRRRPALPRARSAAVRSRERHDVSRRWSAAGRTDLPPVAGPSRRGAPRACAGGRPPPWTASPACRQRRGRADRHVALRAASARRGR